MVKQKEKDQGTGREKKKETKKGREQRNIEQKENYEEKIKEDAINNEFFEFEAEPVKMEYFVGITQEKIQEIFDSIPLSRKKEDLVLNIKKLEDVYDLLLEQAKKINEQRVNAIREEEERKISIHFEHLQRSTELKNKILEEEVANNIKMHNNLKNKHLAEIQRIYQESKDDLLNQAILLVSNYLNITIEIDTEKSKIRKKEFKI